MAQDTGASANPFEPPQAALERPQGRPPGEMSLLDRAWSVFVAPGKTFASIARFPGKDWLLPLGLLVLLALLLGGIVSRRVDVDQAVEQAMAQAEESREMSEADRAQAEEITRTWVGMTVKWIPVASVGGVLLVFFLVPLLWHGIAAAFGKQTTYVRALTGYAFVQMIPVLKMALTIPVALSKPNVDLQGMGTLLKSNLGAFMGQDSPLVLRTLATALDVFDLWALVVAVIAVSRVTRFKTGGAVALVLALWVVYLALVTAPAAIQAMVG